MDIYTIFSMMAKGFVNNLLVTVLSCILPICTGVLWCLLSRTHVVTHRIVKGVSQISESFSPILVCFFVYYGGAVLSRGTGIQLSRFIASVIAFSVCFIGFLPARQKKNESFLKNIVVHSVDLFATVFMWSFVSFAIGYPEMLNKSQQLFVMTFRFEVYVIPFVVCFLFVLQFKVLKFVLDEIMK